MNWKKIGRALVCLALVCCILINASPIRAKAVVSTTVAVGLFALMIACSAGVVFNGLTPVQIAEFGDNFKTSMFQWGTSAEKLDEVEEFFGGLSVYDPDAPEDPGWRGLQVKLAKSILTGISVWMSSIALSGFELKGALAPTDYTYYGSLCLPTIPEAPEGCNYIAIGCNDTYDRYAVFYSPIPFKIYTGSTNWQLRPLTYPITLYYRVMKTSDSKWGGLNTKEFTTTGVNTVSASIPLWANHDVVDSREEETVVLPGSLPSDTAPGTVIEPIQITDIPTLDDGSPDPDEIEKMLPAVIDPSQLLQNTGKADLNEAVQQVVAQLATGEMSYDEFKESIQVVSPPESEPEIEPLPGIGTDDLVDPIGDISGATFFQKLYDVVTVPFRWIWGNIESFFAPLLSPEFWLTPFKWLWSQLEPAFDSISHAVSNAAASTQSLAESLLVPDEDYLSDKIEALQSEFAFVDSIVRTGKALQEGLSGISTEPPVIYLDLGASRGSYYLGGSVPFLDLRFYEEYKPTVDAIISAFLWICFVWRLLIKLPGIISGMPGDFVVGSAHAMGLTNFLPSRSADLEHKRIELRQSVRRGRDG